MEINKSKTVSFKPTPSSDLQYSPNTPTAQISSGYMANISSYGEPRTSYGPLSINPQASSTPADIHTHNLRRGLLSVNSAGSKDSIISQDLYTYDAGFHTPDMRKQVSPSVKGFQSSMLLPESVCIPSLHDPRYRTPDYTLCSGVHVCWSEHSDSSFVYGFMILNYGFGTMTATTCFLYRLQFAARTGHSAQCNAEPKQRNT